MPNAAGASRRCSPVAPLVVIAKRGTGVSLLARTVRYMRLSAGSANAALGLPKSRIAVPFVSVASSTLGLESDSRARSYCEGLIQSEIVKSRSPLTIPEGSHTCSASPTVIR